MRVANQHHIALESALSACGLRVIHLPSDGFPDSVFIEDTAVIVGDVALITRPGASVGS
jgi:dimethylargininase